MVLTAAGSGVRKKFTPYGPHKVPPSESTDTLETACLKDCRPEPVLGFPIQEA